MAPTRNHGVVPHKLSDLFDANESDEVTARWVWKHQDAEAEMVATHRTKALAWGPLVHFLLDVQLPSEAQLTHDLLPFDLGDEAPGPQIAVPIPEGFEPAGVSVSTIDFQVATAYDDSDDGAFQGIAQMTALYGLEVDGVPSLVLAFVSLGGADIAATMADVRLVASFTARALADIEA